MGEDEITRAATRIAAGSDDASMRDEAAVGSVKTTTFDASVMVQEVGPVNPKDVDSYLRVRDADARLDRLKALVGAWEEQQREERVLRKTYAQALIAVLGVEVLGIFAAFFLVGAGVLDVEQWVAQVFLVTAFLQSTSLVVLVVKYLFPERSPDLLRLVEILLSTSPKSPGE